MSDINIIFCNSTQTFLELKKIKFEGNRPDTVSHTVILALFLRAVGGKEIFVGGRVSPEPSCLQQSIPSRYIYYKTEFGQLEWLCTMSLEVK